MISFKCKIAMASNKSLMCQLHKVCVSYESWAAWSSGFGSNGRLQFDPFQLSSIRAHVLIPVICLPTSTVLAANALLNISTGRTSPQPKCHSHGSVTFKSLVSVACRRKSHMSLPQSDN